MKTKRFTIKHKSGSLFKHGKKHPYKSLNTIFRYCHLDYLHDELNCWKELALCNDNSAYNNGRSRENLLLFCGELQKLAEALYLLYDNCLVTNKRKNWRNGLTPEAIVLIMDANKTVLLSEDEILSPLTVPSAFFRKFSIAYAKEELLDLLDAVVNYKSKRDLNRENFIKFYCCLKEILKVANTLSKEADK